MKQENSWRSFFNRCAPSYLRYGFTANTIAEVDFIVRELKLGAGARVLDVGCGVGRHAVELATRQMRVTGIDLSEGMLRQAQQAATAAGVTIDLIQADAMRFSLSNQFDAAICVCEGAFTLLGESEDPFAHDEAILKNIAAALKPGGMFLLTALSALRLIRSADAEAVRSGRFDPVTLVETAPLDPLPDAMTDSSARPVRQRHYVPSELALLCKSCGFEVEHVGGGTAGNWARRAVELDEIELMIIAHRKSS